MYVGSSHCADGNRNKSGLDSIFTAFKQKAPRRVLLCLLRSLKDYLNDTLAEVTDTLPK